MKVSDEAVEAVLSELRINREKRRRIQSMSREELQRYVTNLYKIGIEDGTEACYKALMRERERAEESEEVAVDWEDVLNVIAQVKGVGANLITAIDSKLREVFTGGELPFENVDCGVCDEEA